MFGSLAARLTEDVDVAVGPMHALECESVSRSASRDRTFLYSRDAHFEAVFGLPLPPSFRQFPLSKKSARLRLQ